MKNVREEIVQLKMLGPLPPEDGKNIELFKKYDELYRSIAVPVTDEEARVLITLFGADGGFGLASAFVHLIETAPGWPIKDCLDNPPNEWIAELRDRSIRGGRLPPASPDVADR